MQTVLIAEKDEKQREALLELVNWGVLGFEVTGLYSDGITAMEAIFRRPPDLVFADVDLPRLGGLELIEHIQGFGISSDFVILNDIESFEVARKAMRMGIEEYLLKPVGRDELKRILKKYAERSIGIKGQDINERFFRIKRQLRNSFMDNLTALNAQGNYSIEYMNHKFHFDFREGVFQSAMILVKGISIDESEEFFDSMISDVRARFDPVCYEMLPYIQGHSRVSFTFNYSKDSGVGERLPELYDVIWERLSESGCGDAVFCVGIGLPEYDPARLKWTLETAERAVRCGILRGQNKLYSYGLMEFDKPTSFDILTPTLLGDLKSSAEALDAAKFEHVIRNAFKPLQFGTNPAILIDICWAAVDAVIEVIKTEDDADGLSERKKISDLLAGETTLNGTKSSLVSWAQGLFSRRLKEREYARPVREAVRYIEANCTLPLTLDLVADQVHLNASYFCTIFKNETGQHFSEYLISCRIAEAKRLLRESTLKIAQICSAVGYTDYKHFSHNFTKSVGMKPSEYRSLHG